MKKILVLILFLITGAMSFGKDGRKIEGMKFQSIDCYASGKSHKSFIPPPLQLKSGILRSATIQVDYVGFPTNAQKAFQYAVDIWKNLIYSPVPIHVKANWVSLATDVLGSCSPTDIKTDFNSTQIWNCYYPIALVEKMLGEEVNPVNDYEIDANFNKDFGNWYFGTDGNTPADQYDFVSVVLHEMAHGLGFIGNFYSSKDGKGGYSSGVDNFPAAFDLFVENKSGNKLINTKLFTNPSIPLNQNLTSGWLNFDLLVAGQLPKLYAPKKWDGGSSIYHLDDATYPAGTANALMTHASDMGEAIHDPGPYTMAIMNEIGWKNISIRHKPLKDIENVTSPISYDAQITSDYGLDSTKIFLVYSSNKFAKTDSVLLKANNIPEQFNAKLVQTKNGEIRYFFSATDVHKKRYVLPSNAPSNYLSFNIGIDHVDPVVTHDPIKYMLTNDLHAKIDVEATDNVGIKSVNVEYFVNGGNIMKFALQNDTLDHFTGDLSFAAGSVKDGDQVSYRIIATDVSSQSNPGSLPLSGYFKFYIDEIKSPVEKYVTDLNTPNSDFISSDFTIATPAGFDNPGLNSAHPYLSPDANNTEFNFTAMLKYPIILKEGGKMSYDEIVLVEPGEAGAKFGDTNFFDYVIVEGSTDGGVTWKPLLDGYDSNLQAAWAALFNGSMSGNNSTAVPTKDLFVYHEINLLANGNFKAGDTILVRFRLFSDPYSNGWGWIIDNLNIQDVGTAVSSILLSPGEVSLFPNPAKGKLNLQIQAEKKIHNLALKVYNSSGMMVNSLSFAVESNSFETAIDVSKLIPGLYLFALEPENGQVITRKILVQ